jgi:hypothetical protein
MAHERIGQHDQALALLERLRKAMKHHVGSSDDEAGRPLHEAQALLRAPV